MHAVVYWLCLSVSSVCCLLEWLVWFVLIILVYRLREIPHYYNRLDPDAPFDSCLSEK